MKLFGFYPDSFAVPQKFLREDWKISIADSWKVLLRLIHEKGELRKTDCVHG